MHTRVHINTCTNYDDKYLLAPRAFDAPNEYNSVVLNSGHPNFRCRCLIHHPVTVTWSVPSYSKESTNFKTTEMLLLLKVKDEYGSYGGMKIFDRISKMYDREMTHDNFTKCGLTVLKSVLIKTIKNELGWSPCPICLDMETHGHNEFEDVIFHKDLAVCSVHSQPKK